MECSGRMQRDCAEVPIAKVNYGHHFVLPTCEPREATLRLLEQVQVCQERCQSRWKYRLRHADFLQFCLGVLDTALTIGTLETNTALYEPFIFLYGWIHQRCNAVMIAWVHFGLSVAALGCSFDS